MSDELRRWTPAERPTVPPSPGMVYDNQRSSWVEPINPWTCPDCGFTCNIDIEYFTKPAFVHCLLCSYRQAYNELCDYEELYGPLEPR